MEPTEWKCGLISRMEHASAMLPVLVTPLPWSSRQHVHHWTQYLTPTLVAPSSGFLAKDGSFGTDNLWKRDGTASPR